MTGQSHRKLVLAWFTASIGLAVLFGGGAFLLVDAARDPHTYAAYIAELVSLAVLVTAATAFGVFVRLDKTLARRTAQLLDANTDMLEALGTAIAERDSDTGEHNYRVAYYAVRLGETVGLPRTRIVGLLKGAFLHDIGKIGVRDVLTNRRPYKEAFPIDKSIAIMAKGSDHHFDPGLLALFQKPGERWHDEVRDKNTQTLKTILTACTCH